MARHKIAVIGLLLAGLWLVGCGHGERLLARPPSTAETREVPPDKLVDGPAAVPAPPVVLPQQPAVSSENSKPADAVIDGPPATPDATEAVRVKPGIQEGGAPPAAGGPQAGDSVGAAVGGQAVAPSARAAGGVPGAAERAPTPPSGQEPKAHRTAPEPMPLPGSSKPVGERSPPGDAPAEAGRAERSGALSQSPGNGADKGVPLAAPDQLASALPGARTPGAAPEVRRPSAVDPGQIPTLPPAPPPTTRAKPQGIVRAPAEAPRQPLEVRGRWRQVEGSKGPDFLPGGYSGSTLVFRYDGLLEVSRAFGKGEAVVQSWRVGYQWSKDRSTLTLGADPRRRPPAESLKGFALADDDVLVQAAIQALPVVLPCVDLGDGRIRLGDKVYTHLTETPKATGPKG